MTENANENTQQAVAENTYPASQVSQNTQQAVGENTYPASQVSHDTIGNFTRTALEIPLPYIDIKEIAKYRQELWNFKLIGLLKKGQWANYDYGNISFRMPKLYQKYIEKDSVICANPAFISCSHTSRKLEISMHDFALVVDYITDNHDPDKFEVMYLGISPPSSEIPIHMSAYLADENIGAVIHAHIVNEDYALDAKTPYFSPDVLDFFQKLRFPCTKLRSKTKESGEEICRIIKGMNCKIAKDIPVIGMPNHDGGVGIIIIGKDFKEAYYKTFDFYDNFLRFCRKSTLTQHL